MSRRLLLLSLVSGLAFASSALWAFDAWPQWRGPKRDGASAEKGLLDSWKDDEPPPLVWKAKGLGNGYSGVVVSDGSTVYTVGSREGKPTVIALGDKDGKEVWATEIGDTGARQFGAMCTPTV